MIEPKEDSEQQGKGDSQEDVLDIDIPKMYQPPSVRGRKERRAGGKILQMDALHSSNVHKPSEEDDCQRGSVILDKGAHVVVKQRTAGQCVAKVRNRKDQHGDEDAQVERLGVAQQDEDLNALLEVDEGHVKPKDVAGKAGDVAQPVARVGDGEDPVHDQGPDADPGHEGEVVDASGLHDVVDGVVEDGDGSRNADDDQGLAGEEAEDDGA